MMMEEDDGGGVDALRFYYSYNLLIHCQLFASFESTKSCVICILPPRDDVIFLKIDDAGGDGMGT